MTLFGVDSEGHAAEVSDTVQAVTGRSASTYDEFAADHAAVFRGDAPD